jgi:hypothetical protein
VRAGAEVGTGTGAGRTDQVPRSRHPLSQHCLDCQWQDQGIDYTRVKGWGSRPVVIPPGIGGSSGGRILSQAHNMTTFAP